MLSPDALTVSSSPSLRLRAVSRVVGRSDAVRVRQALALGVGAGIVAAAAVAAPSAGAGRAARSLRSSSAAGRSGGADRAAGQRAPLLHPHATAGRPIACRCGWPSTSARCYEDDDQRGLAHFLEHMAFNGTENFKPGELITFLESIGARFGPHVNAYTSFDETVYMLDVPTDKPGLRRSRPAGAARLRRRHVAPARRDREGTRRRDRRVARPARRRVAADRQAAAGAAREVALRRAAADRHARDSQVVSAPAAGRLLSQVVSPRSNGRGRRRRHRSGRGAEAGRAAVRRASRPPRRRSQPSTAPCRRTRRRCSRSRPIRRRRAGRWRSRNKRPVEIETTVGDYRRSLIQQLATQMLNLRLREIARRPNAPFLGAEAGGSGLGRSVELYELGAAVQEGGIAAGLEALIVEARRMQQFGFTAEELDRARAGAARRLRARLQGARHEREPELRQRVRARVPRTGADSRHRVRIQDRVDVPADRHRWPKSPPKRAS